MSSPQQLPSTESLSHISQTQFANLVHKQILNGFSQTITAFFICCRSILQLAAGTSGCDSFYSDLVGKFRIQLRSPFGHQLGKSLGLKGRTQSRRRTQPPGGKVIGHSICWLGDWLIISQSMNNVVNIVTQSSTPQDFHCKTLHRLYLTKLKWLEP